MSEGNMRNIECSCGSGRKFKHCHGLRETNKSAIALLAGAVVFLSMVLLIVFWPGSSAEPDRSTDIGKITNYAAIPGVNLDQLVSDERYQFIGHLNHTACTCDCEMTLAECRNIDPECTHSKKTVEDLFAQASARHLLSPAASH